MNFSYSNIFTSFDENFLKRLIKKALDQNKKPLSKFFKKSPVAGFKDVSKTPTQLLIEPVLELSKFLDFAAKEVIKIWFEHEDEIKEEVKKYLISKNYNPKEPDFNKDFVKVKKLKDTDVLVLNDKSFINIPLFSENDEKLTYATIISLLYGYVPIETEEEEEANEDIKKGTNLDVKEEELENNNSFNERNLYDLINEVKETYSNFVELTNSLNKNFSEVLEKVKSRQLIETEFDLNQNVKNYNDTHNFLTDKLNLLTEIYSSLSNLFVNEQNKTIYYIDNLDELISSIELLIDKANKEFNELLTQSKNLIYENEIEEFELLLSELESIKNSFNLTGINSIVEPLVKIRELKIKIDNIISSYDLVAAINDFKAGKFKKSLSYIQNFILEKGDEKDFLLFIYFTSNFNYNLNAEQQTIIFNGFSKYLAENDFKVFLLLRNENFIKKIAINEVGKLFCFIAIVFLYSLISKKEECYALFYDTGLDLVNLSEYPTLKQIYDLFFNEHHFIMVDDIPENYDTLLEAFNKKLKEIEEYFKAAFKNELKYQRAFDNFWKKEILKYHDKINSTSGDALKNLQETLRDPKLPSELVEQAKKKGQIPSNKANERKVAQRLKDLIDILHSLTVLKKSETPNYKFINKTDLQKDLDKVAAENSLSIFKAFARIFNSNIELSNQVLFEDFYLHYLLLSNSTFFIQFTHDLIKEIQSTNLDYDKISDSILNSLSTETDIEELLKELDQFKAYNSISKLIVKYNLTYDINEKISADFSTLVEKEQKLSLPPEELSIDYTISKNINRFLFCFNELRAIEKSKAEELLKAEQNIKLRFEELKSRYKNLAESFLTKGRSFSEAIQNKIIEAKNSIEIILANEIINDLDYAYEIITELELIINKPNHNTIKLDELLSRDKDNNIATRRYYDLSIEEILDLIEKDDYENLGLEKTEWNAISSDRLEDIKQLLESCLYLQNNLTVYEHIQNSSENGEEIFNHLKSIHKNLSRICSLQKNLPENDNDYYKWKSIKDDVPFFFFVKILKPRCSHLDKLIRAFVISQKQVKSKKYILAIRDYLEENTNGNILNVFLYLGDKQDLIGINTYSKTKDIPVIDYRALKDIIFGTKKSKLPKWKFASYLILNNRINEIQPFKSEGAINSENNIFVGRDSIIREILNSDKSYAFYGGRKIGKTSLLFAIKNQFENEENCITIYKSFQGTDPLDIARLLLLELSKALNHKIDLEINTYSDFSRKILELFSFHSDKKVIFLLDEVDEYIIRHQSDRHELIEIFRNIYFSTMNKWRFVFAGYKEMYLQIHGRGNYEGLTNPWKNFIDDNIQQLTEIETPEEVLEEGFKNILGLEYDSNVSQAILNYTTGHPAFLQYFCECLIRHIADRISPEQRKIYLDDVDTIFNRQDEFIKYVKETLDLNLSDLQKLIIFCTGIEGQLKFTYQDIKQNIEKYLADFNCRLNSEGKLKLEFELLEITGIIKKTGENNKFMFTHPKYIDILNRLDSLNKDYIDEIIEKLQKNGMLC